MDLDGDDCKEISREAFAEGKGERLFERVTGGRTGETGEGFLTLRRVDWELIGDGRETPVFRTLSQGPQKKRSLLAAASANVL